MSDIYSDSVYVQIKSPCKKRFPSPLMITSLQVHCSCIENITMLYRYFILQLEVFREHWPPPNVSIIELLNEFCNANYLCSFDLSPLGTFVIIQWIRIWDFGLLDPDGDPDRHQNLITWSLGHALPLQEISSKSVATFSVIWRTDKRTEVKT